MSYTSGGIHIDFRSVEVAHAGSEEERVATTVQRVASTFEIGIAEHPEDWHMLQRIWIEDGIYQ